MLDKIISPVSINIYKKFSFITSAFVLLLLLNLSVYSQAPKIGARPDRGIVNGAAYSVSGLDAVNLQNGNVTVKIPLAGLPAVAGGNLSFSLSAYYNSKLWDVTRAEHNSTGSIGCPQQYTVNTPAAADNGGWRIGGSYAIYFRSAREDLDYIIPSQQCDLTESVQMPGQFFKIMLRTPDGAEHEMKLTDSYPTYGGYREYLAGYYKSTTSSIPPDFSSPVRMYSFDGSYLWAVYNPSSDPIIWTIYMNDGTRVEQYRNGIQKIKDANGNSIKIYGETISGGTITHYQDELTEREIKQTDTFINNQHNTQIQYQTVGGTWQTINIVWGTTNVQGKLYWIQGWDTLQEQICDHQDVLGGGMGELGVIREIVFPATEQGVSPQKYTFSYNSDTTTQATTNQPKWGCGQLFPPYTRTVSNGMGELSEINTPSGAKINYDYYLDDSHDIGVAGGSANEMARNVLTTKTLTHDGTVDTWTYGISPLPSSTSGSVTNPDGSTSTEYFYPTDAAFSRLVGGVDGKGGLVYKTNQSNKIITERHWTLMPFTGGVLYTTGALGNLVGFNPVMDAEYTSLLNDSGQAVKMSAKTFQYDYNGNLLEIKIYDWFDLSTCSVTRDSVGVPTAVPTCATLLRTSTSSFYNQASTAGSTNVYAKRDTGTASPRILSAVQQLTTGPSTTQFSYDNLAYGVAPTLGNLTKISNWLDYPVGQWIDTTIAYDSYGNATSVTDPEGNVVSVVYGDSTHANPTSVTVNPNNGTGAQTNTRTFDFSTGLITSETDINGHTSTIDYTNQLLGAVDPFGRPGIVYSPTININGTNQRRSTTTYYEDSANRVRVETDVNAEGDRFLKTRTSTDQLGRTVLSEWSEDGVSYTISSQNVYLYLAGGGSVTLTSNPTRDNGATTDGWTRSTTDILGRVVDVATFSGSSQPPSTGGYTSNNFTGRVTTTYDLNTVKVIDQAGKSRKSVMNAIGQLIKVYEDPDGVNFETSYSYDLLGNLVKVKQGSGSQMQYRYFMYDSLLRLIRAKNPEEDVNTNLALTDSVSGNSDWALSYAYDKNGNLTSKTDARNTTITYTYDGLDRIVSRSYTNDPTNTPSVSYTYDIGVSNAKGRLVSITSTVSTTSYTGYDELGMVKGSSQTIDGTTYTTTYTYNLSGALVSQTYPSGRVVKNVYDAMGDLIQVFGKVANKPMMTYANEFKYTAHGAVEGLRLGNNRWESTQFNSRLQPTQIALGTTQNATDLLKLNYTYGVKVSGVLDTTKNNGNVESQTITVPAVGQTPGFVAVQYYTYDSLNRLYSATEMDGSTQNWKQTYIYDSFGNRNFDMANTTYPNTGTNPDKVINPEILKSDNRFKLDQDNDLVNDYLYDENGNLTKDATGKRFAYDAENKQKSFGTNEEANNGAFYYYDGGGRRVKKFVVATSETTIFVYNASGQMVAEYSTTPPPANGTISYLTTDTLGTPRINTNHNGQVSTRHDYLPFGEEITLQLGQETMGGRYGHPDYAQDNIRQKFTQYERDEESGLDFADSRFYSSPLGRFMSIDPVMISDLRLSNPQIWNSYSYVGNNPLSFSDPLGMERIPLGDSEATIRQDIETKKNYIASLEAQKKALKANKKSLSKEDYEKSKKDIEGKIKAAKGELNTLNTKLAGTIMVNAMLQQLQNRGEANNLQLSDIEISTDPSRDFPNAKFPMSIDKINAFVIQKADRTGPDYGGKIFINTKGELWKGAINGRDGGTSKDWILYGASALRHEQWHRDAPTHNDRISEKQAYTKQLPILKKYQHDFSSSSFYEKKKKMVEGRMR